MEATGRGISARHTTDNVDGIAAIHAWLETAERPFTNPTYYLDGLNPSVYLTRDYAPLADRIDQGRGLTPADLVLKGARVFDLVTGTLVETDVAICGDTIVGVFGSYTGQREIDLSGKVLVPGFIDTHLHIESSLVTPFEFDRCVTPRGVTTAICDPHEIANVKGKAGIGGVVHGKGNARHYHRDQHEHGDGTEIPEVIEPAPVVEISHGIADVHVLSVPSHPEGLLSS
mgnify:CR=1 FL=1